MPSSSCTEKTLWLQTLHRKYIVMHYAQYKMHYKHYRCDESEENKHEMPKKMGKCFVFPQRRCGRQQRSKNIQKLSFSLQKFTKRDCGAFLFFFCDSRKNELFQKAGSASFFRFETTAVESPAPSGPIGVFSVCSPFWSERHQQQQQKTQANEVATTPPTSLLLR